MSDFLASNGIQVLVAGPRLQIGAATLLSPLEVIAAREFFRAEEDKRLGRWRYPEDPDFIVYPNIVRNGEAAITVIYEPGGGCTEWTRDVAADGAGSPPRDAALAYFAAHPEQRPWDDAKPGEVWAFTLDCLDGEYAASLHAKGEWTWADGGPVNVAAGTLVGARRIWPEAD
jgi:hypothetical protein